MHSVTPGFPFLPSFLPSFLRPPALTNLAPQIDADWTEHQGDEGHPRRVLVFFSRPRLAAVIITQKGEGSRVFGVRMGAPERGVTPFRIETCVKSEANKVL